MLQSDLETPGVCSKLQMLFDCAQEFAVKERYYTGHVGWPKCCELLWMTDTKSLHVINCDSHRSCDSKKYGILLVQIYVFWWHVSGLHHTWVFNKYGKQVNTSEFSLAHFPLVTSGRCCSARGLRRWLHMCLSHPTSGLLQASQLIFGLPLRGNDCLVSASESFSLFL